MPVNYNLLFNQATLETRSSPTFAVAAKAKARRDASKEVFDFSVGQPAEPTPEYVRTGVDQMIANDGRWKAMSVYSPVPGLPELKQAIVDKFADENGIEYQPNQILITNGGKQAIFDAFFATIEKGDEVLMAEPSWVSYPDIVKRLGGQSIGLRTNRDFKFSAETLEATLREHPAAKWLVINSPSNPTGGTYTKEELEAIADVVLAENKRREEAGKPPLMVMSDDIYEHMVYDDRYVNKPGDPSAITNNIIMANPDMKPYTVIVNGVAKAFAMTGHRVGYAAGPKEIIAKMSDCAQGVVTSGVSAMEQLTSTVALSREHKAEREAWFTAQRESYKKRRDLVAQLINQDGSSMSFTPTPGAFYAMIDCTDMARKVDGCHNLANQMIDQYGVALVPGDDFYIEPKKQDRTYLRMSFATDEDTIRKGIAAMHQAEKDILPDARERVAVASSALG